MAVAPTVGALVLRQVVRHVRERGADAAGFATEFGLTEAPLADDEARILVLQAFGLLERAAELTGDVDVGLHLAEAARFEDFGVFGYLAASGATVFDGLRAATRYLPLLIDLERAELAVDGETAEVRLHKRAEFPATLPTSEYVMGTFHVFCSMLATTPWQLREVRFRHPRPKRIEAHERFFAAPVIFEADRDCLRFSRSMLDVASRHADAGLAKLLRIVAEQQLGRIAGAPRVVDQVRWQVWNDLLVGRFSVAPVATKLGVSTRSLQRSLSDAGSSHGEILTGIRAELAKWLLRQTDMGLVEVSSLLGFADQSAFQKAFRRWTGTTPAAFRAAASASQG